MALTLRDLGRTVAKGSRANPTAKEDEWHPETGGCQMEEVTTTCRRDPSHTHHDAHLMEKPSGFQNFAELCILEEHLERKSQHKMSVGTMNQSFIWNLWLNTEVSKYHAPCCDFSQLTPYHTLSRRSLSLWCSLDSEESKVPPRGHFSLAETGSRTGMKKPQLTASALRENELGDKASGRTMASSQ